MNDNIFDDPPPDAVHTPRRSVVTEITIPGCNMVFCVQKIAYDEVKKKVIVKTSLGTQAIEILEDCYTLDVSRYVQEKTDTEPIIYHSHEE
ncbi:MAG: hypothetical protein WCT49_00985 [Candidatus Paceibacterota bacterium]